MLKLDPIRQHGLKEDALMISDMIRLDKTKHEISDAEMLLCSKNASRKDIQKLFKIGPEYKR